MISYRLAAAALTAVALCACSGGGGGRTLPADPSEGSGSSQTTSAQTVQAVPAGSAASVTETTYDESTYSSDGIAIASDGAVWWATSGVAFNAPALVRFENGATTTVPVVQSPVPVASGLMTATPNGRVWAAFNLNIGEQGASYLIYFASEGAPQAHPQYGFDLGTAPLGYLATSPDGNVWFAQANGVSTGPPPPSIVGYILENATGASSDVHDVGPQNGDNIMAVGAGPDGNMWAGGISPAGKVVFERYTTSGTPLAPVTTNLSATTVGALVAGSDGAVWFTDPDQNIIGRVTSGGSVTTYPVPTASSGVSDIVVGGDGALWFTEGSAYKLGRITTAGQFSEYPLPTNSVEPSQIAASIKPKCNLWLSMGNDVVEVTTKT